eukprot:gb/GECH01009602.1/.p1 GENE.gb/GECH01009602.1/~~gb/GECH01009602.1/.p1  ORF type:complete len:2411 (+),score=388.27 gb/GECH01009602.1/:1-7233(+)
MQTTKDVLHTARTEALSSSVFNFLSSYNLSAKQKTLYNEIDRKLQKIIKCGKGEKSEIHKLCLELGDLLMFGHKRRKHSVEFLLELLVYSGDVLLNAELFSEADDHFYSRFFLELEGYKEEVHDAILRDTTSKKRDPKMIEELKQNLELHTRINQQICKFYTTRMKDYSIQFHSTVQFLLSRLFDIQKTLEILFEKFQNSRDRVVEQILIRGIFSLRVITHELDQKYSRKAIVFYCLCAQYLRSLFRVELLQELINCHVDICCRLYAIGHSDEAKQTAIKATETLDQLIGDQQISDEHKSHFLQARNLTNTLLLVFDSFPKIFSESSSEEYESKIIATMKEYFQQVSERLRASNYCLDIISPSTLFTKDSINGQGQELINATYKTLIPFFALLRKRLGIPAPNEEEDIEVTMSMFNSTSEDQSADPLHSPMTTPSPSAANDGSSSKKNPKKSKTNKQQKSKKEKQNESDTETQPNDTVIPEDKIDQVFHMELREFGILPLIQFIRATFQHKQWKTFASLFNIVMNLLMHFSEEDMPDNEKHLEHFPVEISPAQIQCIYQELQILEKSLHFATASSIDEKYINAYYEAARFTTEIISNGEIFQENSSLAYFLLIELKTIADQFTDENQRINLLHLVFNGLVGLGYDDVFQISKISSQISEFNRRLREYETATSILKKTVDIIEQKRAKQMLFNFDNRYHSSFSVTYTISEFEQIDEENQENKIEEQPSHLKEIDVLYALHTEFLFKLYHCELLKGREMLFRKKKQQHDSKIEGVKEKMEQSHIFKSATKSFSKKYNELIENMPNYPETSRKYEQFLWNRCGENLYEQVLMLICVADFRIKKKEKEEILFKALDILKQIEKKEFNIVKKLCMKDTSDALEVKSKGSNSIRLRLQPLNGEQSTYLLYGRNASLGSTIGIEDTNYIGLGIPISYGDHIISQLEKNQRYVFAYQTIDKQGVPKSDLSNLTSPISTVLPVPLQICWIYLVQTAFEHGLLEIAKQAGSQLLAMYLAEDGEEKKLNHTKVRNTSPAILRGLIRVLFIVVEMSISQEQLPDEIEDEFKYNILNLQIKRMHISKQLVIALEISEYLKDDDLICESICRLYGCLQPVLSRIPNHSVLIYRLKYVLEVLVSVSSDKIADRKIQRIAADIIYLCAWMGRKRQCESAINSAVKALVFLFTSVKTNILESVDGLSEHAEQEHLKPSDKKSKQKSKTTTSGIHSPTFEEFLPKRLLFLLSQFYTTKETAQILQEEVRDPKEVFGELFGTVYPLLQSDLDQAFSQAQSCANHPKYSHVASCILEMAFYNRELKKCFDWSDQIITSISGRSKQEPEVPPASDSKKKNKSRPNSRSGSKSPESGTSKDEAATKIKNFVSKHYRQRKQRDHNRRANKLDLSYKAHINAIRSMVMVELSHKPPTPPILLPKQQENETNSKKGGKKPKKGTRSNSSRATRSPSPQTPEPPASSNLPAYHPFVSNLLNMREIRNIIFVEKIRRNNQTENQKSEESNEAENSSEKDEPNSKNNNSKLNTETDSQYSLEKIMAEFQKSAELSSRNQEWERIYWICAITAHILSEYDPQDLCSLFPSLRVITECLLMYLDYIRKGKKPFSKRSSMSRARTSARLISRASLPGDLYFEIPWIQRLKQHSINVIFSFFQTSLKVYISAGKYNSIVHTVAYFNKITNGFFANEILNILDEANDIMSHEPDNLEYIMAELKRQSQNTPKKFKLIIKARHSMGSIIKNTILDEKPLTEIDFSLVQQILSNYQNTVTFLREKHEVTSLMQTLNELGEIYVAILNKPEAAKKVWRDSLDCVFENYDTISEWRGIQESVEWKDIRKRKRGNELLRQVSCWKLILGIVAAGRLAQFSFSQHVYHQQECCLLAASFIKSILSSSIEHPKEYDQFLFYTPKDIIPGITVFANSSRYNATVLRDSALFISNVLYDNGFFTEILPVLSIVEYLSRYHCMDMNKLIETLLMRTYCMVNHGFIQSAMIKIQHIILGNIFVGKLVGEFNSTGNILDPPKCVDINSEDVSQLIKFMEIEMDQETKNIYGDYLINQCSLCQIWLVLTILRSNALDVLSPSSYEQDKNILRSLVQSVEQKVKNLESLLAVDYEEQEHTSKYSIKMKIQLTETRATLDCIRGQLDSSLKECLNGLQTIDTHYFEPNSLIDSVQEYFHENLGVPIVCRLYFTAAHLSRASKNYEFSKSLCEKGIEFCKFFQAKRYEIELNLVYCLCLYDQGFIDESLTSMEKLYQQSNDFHLSASFLGKLACDIGNVYEYIFKEKMNPYKLLEITEQEDAQSLEKYFHRGCRLLRYSLDFKGIKNETYFVSDIEEYIRAQLRLSRMMCVRGDLDSALEILNEGINRCQDNHEHNIGESIAMAHFLIGRIKRYFLSKSKSISEHKWGSSGIEETRNHL